MAHQDAAHDGPADGAEARFAGRGAEPDAIGPIESVEDPDAPTRIAAPRPAAGYAIDRIPALAAGLLVLSGAVVLASLVLTHHIGVFRAYEFPVSDATQGAVGLLLWTCAALAGPRRTRSVGTGMACSLTAALIMRDLTLLDPRYPTATVTEPARFLLPAQATALIATLLLLVEVRRRAVLRRHRANRRAALPTPPPATSSRACVAARIGLTATGLAGAALWLLGSLQTWLTGGTGFADGSQTPLTVSCCSLHQADGRMLAGTIGGAVLLVAAVLSLAWLRPARIGFGLALGVLVLMLPDLAGAVVEIFAPLQSFIGFSPVARLGSDLYGLVVTTAVHEGFYLALAAFAVLLSTLILRAAVGWEPAADPAASPGDGAAPTAGGTWHIGRGARRGRAAETVPDEPQGDEVFELHDDIDIIEF